jgi:hypothetical protein
MTARSGFTACGGCVVRRPSCGALASKLLSVTTGAQGIGWIRMNVENPRYDDGRWPPRLGEAHAATTVRPLDAWSRGRKMMGPVP